jgi:hypothetical protein
LVLLAIFAYPFDLATATVAAWGAATLAAFLWALA